MSKPNSGGPAFPAVTKWVTDVHHPDELARDYSGVTEMQPGMSLRAWLAGMAMQGYRSRYGISFNTQKLAECSLFDADALIAELEKEVK